MSKINIGQKAPNFTLPNENGDMITLSSLKGQNVVLFFYPKDDSPSCTKEACSVRDFHTKIERKNTIVFGISPDNEKKHKKFIDKYDLNYSLLADPDKEVIQLYGLWGEKKFMGKSITGVYRTTIIIDTEGNITDIIDKVKTSEHGEQIIESLEALEMGQTA